LLSRPLKALLRRWNDRDLVRQFGSPQAGCLVGDMSCATAVRNESAAAMCSLLTPANYCGGRRQPGRSVGAYLFALRSTSRLRRLLAQLWIRRRGQTQALRMCKMSAPFSTLSRSSRYSRDESFALGRCSSGLIGYSAIYLALALASSFSRRNVPSDRLALTESGKRCSGCRSAASRPTYARSSSSASRA
jgi:hypothetical protein